LLRRIEEDKDKEVRMNVLEQQVANLVSKAQLAVYPLSLSPLLAELTSLGRWAWSSDEDAISDAEHEELEQAASTLSASQLVSWIGNIEATGDSSFPGRQPNRRTSVMEPKPSCQLPAPSQRLQFLDDLHRFRAALAIEPLLASH
jgi:hypothetical protein